MNWQSGMDFYHRWHRKICGCVLIITLAGAIYLTHRFSVIKISQSAQRSEIPQNSYLLIDWQFHKGRQLKEDDWVVLDDRQRPIKLGKIISPLTTQWPGMAEQRLPQASLEYLIEVAADSERRVAFECHPLSQIRGRVLLVFSDGAHIPLPRH